MAIIENGSQVLSSHSSNQLANQLTGQLSERALTRWSQALHHASLDFAEEQAASQLWKQQHKQGGFGAGAKFGFSGMLSRLQNQRRTNR